MYLQPYSENQRTASERIRILSSVAPETEMVLNPLTVYEGAFLPNAVLLVERLGQDAPESLATDHWMIARAQAPAVDFAPASEPSIAVSVV